MGSVATAPKDYHSVITTTVQKEAKCVIRLLMEHSAVREKVTEGKMMRERTVADRSDENAFRYCTLEFEERFKKSCEKC